MYHVLIHSHYVRVCVCVRLREELNACVSIVVLSFFAKLIAHNDISYISNILSEYTSTNKMEYVLPVLCIRILYNDVSCVRICMCSFVLAVRNLFGCDNR